MTTQHTPPEGLRAWLAAPQDDPPWSTGEIVLTAGVLALCTLLIASVVASLVSEASPAPPAAGFLLGWMVGLMLAGAFVLVRWRQSPEKFAALMAGDSRFPLLIMALIGIGAAFTGDLIAAWGSEFGVVAVLRGLETTPQALVIAALFLLVVQPVVEALIFAGVMLPRLRASIGAWPGLLLTAFLFAGYHYLVFGARLALDNNAAFWYSFMLPFVVGLVMLAMRVYADSTRAAMAVHAGSGLVALAVFILL
jgi:membrane protease YdiL (CAAX protease family)